MGFATSLRFLGHATFLFETPAGKRIMLDPFLTDNPQCPEAYRTDPGPLDAMLITHLHSDHVGDAVRLLQSNPECHALGVIEVAGWLSSHGVTNLEGANIDGEVPVCGAKVSFVQAVHTSSFTEPDGTLVSGGDPVGFVIEFSDGLVVYAAGDTGVFGDMALIRELYAPHLALLPIGGYYTMGPRQAAHAMRLLGYPHVLPFHYGTFPTLTGTPAAMKELVPAEYAGRIHVVAPGELLGDATGG
ncbi:MAG: metal-dependent hydrolase [Armatimonadetes bacterium]|nr:metal-dependent hydrolase [Armatimonadota bacterium]MDE2205426.1 metal-dependent hydrolase [Armatimonadota bacterium]